MYKLQKKLFFLFFTSLFVYGQSPETNFSPSINKKEVIDFAIVGGGIAGLYSAYRLTHGEIESSPIIQQILKQSGNTKLTIQLYESKERLGGRIWSIPIPGTSLIAELGAMRFSPSHKNFYGLIHDELQLETTPFSMDGKIVYLREHMFAFHDFSDSNDYPNVIPYFVKKNEIRKDPTDLLLEALYSSIPEARTANSMDQLVTLLRSTKIKGKYLYEWGLWNFLMDQLDPEAFQLVYDTFGYGGIDCNGNAYASYLQYFRSFIFQSHKELVTIKAGMEEAIHELAKRFSGAGGQIHLHNHLQSIQKIEAHGESLLQLSFSSPNDSSNTKTVYARNVILAIPKQSLLLLDQNSFFSQNEPFKNDLDSVAAMEANKLFLVYKSPWWKNVPFIASNYGKSFTSLPLQNIYYFGSQEDGKYEGYSLLLASYASGRFTNFWSSFMDMDSTSYQSSFVKKEGLSQHPLLASNMIVYEAQKELKESHHYDVPDPVLGIYIDWSKSSFGGAFHYWKQNVKTWEMIPKIQAPFPDANIYIVGEAYSSLQGWIEGAVNTAESVLHENFQLKPPHWILNFQEIDIK